MLMKIAIVLISLLMILAAFTLLFDTGEENVKGEGGNVLDDLDCVMINKEDAKDDCGDTPSSGGGGGGRNLKEVLNPLLSYR
jgi:hypothetical protein